MEKEHEVLFIKGLRRKKLRFGVLPDSSLCQNGKQVEIITKMIFELCYIEAIAFIITTIETTIDCIVTIVSIVVYIVLLYDRVVLK